MRNRTAVTQLCPNRAGHTRPIACVTCRGMATFSLPVGAWRVLLLVAAKEALTAGDKSVAGVLAMRGLCLPEGGAYRMTPTGCTALDEHTW